MAESYPRILITGASGLLGRAVLEQANQRRIVALGTGLSRTSDQVKKLDLNDGDAVVEFLKTFKPDVVIHCAAQRRPDVAEKDPKATRVLNVMATSRLAKLTRSKDLPFGLLYISTDYVFDGKAPEGGYQPEDNTNPLNLYGETKLAGEHEIIKESVPGKGLILRVPVLYGKAEPKESSVNILTLAVRDASKPAKMDNWAIRYPTNVSDVGRVLIDLALRLHQGSLGQLSSPILQFSAQEKFTKYTMAKIFASCLNLAGDHIVAVSDEPKPDETQRPKDCHLSNRALEEIGVDVRAETTFEHWWRDYLNGPSV